MNIFLLDLDPVARARAHQDTHLGVCLKEIVQALCCAHPEPPDPLWRLMSTGDRMDSGLLPYARNESQRNNPVCVWTRASRANYRFACAHGRALAEERRYRLRRGHASEEALLWCALRVPPGLPDLPADYLSSFVQVMPERYRVPGDPVSAYRAYYRAEKRLLRGIPATWTRRPVPEWFVL